MLYPLSYEGGDSLMNVWRGKFYAKLGRSHVRFLSRASRACLSISSSTLFALATPSAAAEKHAVLVDRTATGEIEHRTGAEGAIGSAKPTDQRSDFIDLAEAAHGDLRQHEINMLLRHLFEHGGLDGGGCHAVDAYSGLS